MTKIGVREWERSGCIVCELMSLQTVKVAQHRLDAYVAPARSSSHFEFDIAGADRLGSL
jgi:hypothetical protein